MFDNTVNCIIWLLIIGMVWWLVSFLPIPAPLGTIITVLFIVLAVVVILSIFGVVPLGVPRLFKGA